MNIYTDFYTFLKEHDGEAFRYLVYRRMFTPYEQNECFVDETVYEDTHFNVGVIVDCIVLGNGDFLLGFQSADDIDPNNMQLFDNVDYYKLSEIRLSLYNETE